MIQTVDPTGLDSFFFFIAVFARAAAVAARAIAAEALMARGIARGGRGGRGRIRGGALVEEAFEQEAEPRGPSPYELADAGAGAIVNNGQVTIWQDEMVDGIPELAELAQKKEVYSAESFYSDLRSDKFNAMRRPMQEMTRVIQSYQ